MTIEIRPVAVERLADAMHPIATNFGLPLPPERVARFAALPELDTRLGAFDGEELVGAASSFTFELTVPGGAAVETAGLTLVGVLPTHRRRGVLRSLMRRYLDGVHARGQALSALIASEAPIYGRFGYGMAQLAAEIDLPRGRAAFLRAPSEPRARVRLLGEAEATAAFTPIYERARRETPGMLSRSEAWWRLRRTGDPEWARAGRPPLQRALVEVEGEPAAYALYRLSEPTLHRGESPALEITEATATSPEATRALWRYLLDLDVVERWHAFLPVDHPLQLLLADPRALGSRLSDGVWVRLVDVGAALARRSYGAGEAVVLEVTDPFCPWNTGRYRVGGGSDGASTAEAEVALDVDALGAVYLGAFTFAELAGAGRAVERRAGALERADALFRTARAPWCPETF